MSKPSPTGIADTNTAEALPTKPRTPPAVHAQDASRETLESIAFAFVLALLFRTFVAEAFVIPTGSMAPTLFGRNKDVVCTECHYPYQVGASEELDEVDGYLIGRIDDSVCPNCRHLNKIRELPVFKGDRILVNKFPYQMGEPDRWDVIVFRYPEDPQKNYIKRLVGLPNETIQISRGDVYAKKGEQGEFAILRKQNPYKQKVLQQLVYDDRYASADLVSKGRPERWTAMIRTDAKSLDGWNRDENSWKHDSIARRFSIDASDERKWIRYQHLVPSRGDWDSPIETSDPATETRPQLITDFCGYNSYTGGRNQNHGSRNPNLDDDHFWVGDLTLNCSVEITSINGPSSELILELVEGVRRYRCRIDVTSGNATLLRNDDLAADSNAAEIEMASAATPIRGPGKYSMTFANVDDRLCLWVNPGWQNRGLIAFGSGAEYSSPANRDPQEADLVPAGLAVRGVAARVSDLVLQRDIYYRADSVPGDDRKSPHDHGSEVPRSISFRDCLTDPVTYGNRYNQYSREATFNGLRSDEFFVMGDNSPRSQDSRLWSNNRNAYNRHAVPRQALLGKAFFIYWPHGIPFLNHGKGFTLMNHSVHRDQRGQPLVDTYPEYVVPFYPQWWRWKRIR